MRQRFTVTLAAGARWPDAQSGRSVPGHNWIKLDNRGANSVLYGFSGPQNDPLDYYLSVAGGETRVVNLGPTQQVLGESSDGWASEVHLFSPGGTTVLIEIADHPIVDLAYIAAPTVSVANPPGTPSGTTNTVYGTATAPAASGAVVSTVSLSAGNYRIAVLASYGGTADAIDNMQLALPAGSSPAGPFRLRVLPAANGTPILSLCERVAIAAGVISVQAVAAGAGGTIYVASLIYTPVV